MSETDTASVKTKPTIFVPPRGSMESLFMNGSGPGFSPGPMTMVSSFFAEQSPFSFSQLLAGAMASPNPGLVLEEKGSEPVEEAKGGEEGYKKNRPVNLVVAQPQQQLPLQMQLESLSPLFMVPPGLSPTGLLNSPGFMSPLQSPFGMSHQQALAHVTAQAAFSQSYLQMQAELQRSIPTANVEPVVNHSTAPVETSNPPPSEPEILRFESSEVSQSDTKAVYGDKPASDGYNWRKYGQKHVKASECPRSYYKCTYINCPVKKKVERSLDGRISEITYKGQHNHDPPQNTKRGKDIGAFDRTSNPEANAAFASSQMEPNSAHEPVHVNSESANNQGAIQHATVHSRNDENLDTTIVLHDGNDDEPAAKRRMLDTGPSIPASTFQTISDSKIVVQTRSEVDLLDDGYKWRKYGQKVVKGNPHPRSYYRCTYAGCNVRKHVERASADPKAVITTYEGKHNHEIPAGRYSNYGAASAGSVKAQKTTASKSGSLKEMDYGSDQMPMTLQLKEEQIAAA